METYIHEIDEMVGPALVKADQLIRAARIDPYPAVRTSDSGTNTVDGDSENSSKNESGQDESDIDGDPPKLQ
jgi:hypothetical protein